MINVYEQIITESDAKAAYDAVQTGILSSFGQYVPELENRFATYIGRKHSLTCSNGTAALLLALHGLDIRGSKVAVPSCSFAATAFAAIAANNRIEYIDVDPSSLNLDLDQLERKCEYSQEYDPIKCVIAVHTYGNPYDHDRLKALATKYNFKIIEDACEALCATYNDKKIGQLGDVSVFSFYGNKLIACGEGGMVLTDDDEIANRIKLFRGQGQDPNRRFWHIIPGFNYRMTNVQAAIVLSQLNRIDYTQHLKQRIADLYVQRLSGRYQFQRVLTGSTHAWWMVTVLTENLNFYREACVAFKQAEIETRPIFPSLASMPFNKNPYIINNCELVSARGISLPSGPATSLDNINKICDILLTLKTDAK